MPERETPSWSEQPYALGGLDERILRDHLPAGRTEFANERTLLGCVRTALASAITGGTMLHLLTGPLLTAFGATCAHACPLCTLTRCV